MRFAVYSLAFFLFICTWNLEHAFGDRRVLLKEIDCKPSDVYCGVEVRALPSAKETKHKDKFDILRRVIVLRKLMEDARARNRISPPKAPHVNKYSVGECLGKFCVVIYDDPDVAPFLKMSYPDPMIDEDNFDMHTPGNNLDPYTAPTLPVYPLMPKLGYSCDAENSLCRISSSAYGAPSFSYDIPIDKKISNFLGFNTKYYKNGLSVCVLTYCVFVHKKESVVRSSFNVNHYVNIPSVELTANSDYEIEYDRLINSKHETQVMITLEQGADDKKQYKCTYDRPANSNGAPKLSLTELIDIPEDANDLDSQPILRFKAKNGVGACVGYGCCFKEDTNNEKLLIKKFDPKNESLLSWVKKVDPEADFEINSA